MVQRTSARRDQMLRQFGSNVRRWRRVNQLTTLEVAERASVTRETLRNIETGTGSPRLESVFAVLSALGIAESIVDAADPLSSDVGRVRVDAILRAGKPL